MLFRDNIERMTGYVPGEQTLDHSYIKLNTNENPYPPSPAVSTVLSDPEALRLNRYPDPIADTVRDAAAAVTGTEREWIIVGNGGDDLLTIAMRAFVNQGGRVAFFDPSYSLYPVLADIQGAVSVAVPLADEFDLPHDVQDRIDGADLLFVTRPNAPSGNAFAIDRLAEIVTGFAGVVLIDEAYTDFAADNCLDLVKRLPGLIILRTLSKGYSLAGIRLGYAVADPQLVEGMMKVKDSYNVNGITQRLAAAALQDQTHMAANVDRICVTRQRTTDALAAMGFQVLPSQANFIFTRPPLPAARFAQDLRDNGILVRHFSDGRVKDYVRVSIGTDEEMDAFLNVTEKIVAGG